MITYPRKLNPRAEYRLLRNKQINKSASLAEKFPRLKALKVTVDYFDSAGATRTGGMKYKVNLVHGRSHFCFNCVHGDCIGGDYDLTKELATAISRQRKVVEGEMSCPGTRHNEERKEDRPCLSILRYKLTLAFSAPC